MADAPLTPCGECGMPCSTGEYHPFAACLMFKACHSSDVVRANLESVRDDHPGAFVLLGSMREWYRIHGSLHFDQLLEEVDKILAAPPSPPVAAPPATPVALGRYVIFTRPGKVPERKGPYPTKALMERALRDIQQAYPDANSMVLIDLPDDCWPTSGVEWIDMHGDKRKGRLIASQPQPAQPLTDEQIKAVIEGVWRIEDARVSDSWRNIVRAVERAHGIGITAPSTPTPPEVAP